ncbi:hypothetical protein Tter_0638 [Thermobaculum terrenum ATCC BAA-798]|uniref:Uncharacterized protein n=1 Tax=Thermobaculum terrenum (strain ATCC BAA-798 / CCMEE 7001 / YNP1) TaxID=525904 RepID=D1CF49_THET1|nr:hypothetical protein Tter_0638 [Thermobaculum terrenum ATCC BAA-798]
MNILSRSRVYSLTKVKAIVLCYLLWLVLVVLSFFCGIQIWRPSIALLLYLIFRDSDAGHFFYLSSVVVVAIITFSFMMLSEYYLREGIPKGLLWSRFLSLFLFVSILVLVGLTLQYVLWMLI